MTGKIPAYLRLSSVKSRFIKIDAAPTTHIPQDSGLSALVEQELEHNPFDGGLYAFTNRKRDKIKCLFWEDNGFVLYYKSLAEEKFRWPRQGEELRSLTGQQINWLLDGYDIMQMKGHEKLHYESVF